MIEVDKIREAAGCSRLFLRRSSCCLQSLCGGQGTVPTSKVTLGRVVPRDLLLPMSHHRRQPFRPKQQPGRRGEDALEWWLSCSSFITAQRVPDRAGVQIVNWNQYLSILFDLSSNSHLLLNVDNCAEKRGVQWTNQVPV